MTMGDSILHSTICPFCGFMNELVSAAFDPEATPDDGDFSVCFQCNRVGIFDSTNQGGSRKPNQSELMEIATNPDILRVVQSLIEIKKKHDTESQSGQGLQDGGQSTSVD